MLSHRTVNGASLRGASGELPPQRASLFRTRCTTLLLMCVYPAKGASGTFKILMLGIKSGKRVPIASEVFL
jgi:hypothetical protein